MGGNGMFSGAPFSRQAQGAAVPAKPMPGRPVQAIPKNPAGFGATTADRFVPSAPALGGRGVAIPQAPTPFGGKSPGDKFVPALGGPGSGAIPQVSGGVLGQTGFRKPPAPKLAHRPTMGQGPYGASPTVVDGQGMGPAEVKPGGKRSIGLEEAKALLQDLEVALAPITEAEAAQEDHDCLREMKAGPFPVVVRLAERLRNFVATAQPTSLFEISHGELTVTQKALECAESIGRAQTVKTVATAAGVGGGALALLLLL